MAPILATSVGAIRLRAIPPLFCSGISVSVLAAAGRLLWWGGGGRCFVGGKLIIIIHVPTREGGAANNNLGCEAQLSWWRKLKREILLLNRVVLLLGLFRILPTPISYGVWHTKGGLGGDRIPSTGPTLLFIVVVSPCRCEPLQAGCRGGEGVLGVS